MKERWQNLVYRWQEEPGFRRTAWLGGTLVLLLLFLLSYGIYGYIHQNRQPVSSSTPSLSQDQSGASPNPTPTPVQIPALLDGEFVPKGEENLHPLAVMIENTPEARPQAGLGEAQIVYEAIAEGGITRFMAVFQDPRKAVKVGPIRSARTYFVDLATEISAFYAHVGGNMDALDQIRNQGGVLDLDQFRVGDPTYQREFSRPVALEHTMYSSTDKLWDYAINHNHWSATDDFTPWQFQDVPKQELLPANQLVKVSVSSSAYDVTWTYDKTTDSYLRSEGGTPQLDLNTNQQIRVKNIILQTVQRRPTVTRINEEGWIYTLTGSGQALLVQNGVVTSVTWRKQGTERTRYYDSTNKEISFVRGPIWIQLIHPDSTVSY